MKSALVVIDMLNDFIDGALANPAATGTVAPIVSLVDKAHARDGLTVVYANDAHEPADLELRIFPPHAMAGTPGAEVIDELSPQAHDAIVPKHFYSAFTGSELDDVLRSRGVGRLVLTGQHTDCCLRHTAYDAFLRGYELVVCTDATTVFEPESEEPVELRNRRALEYLRHFYGARLLDSASLD